MNADDYAQRFAARDNLADGRAAFVGAIEALSDDGFFTPEQTTARLRAIVAGLRLTEGRER